MKGLYYSLLTTHYSLLTFFVILLPLLFHGKAWGHEELPSGRPGVAGDVGINERVGQTIPLDAEFYNEHGNAVTLKQLFKKPVVLSLVYFSCDRVCPLVLAAVADVTSELKLVPGKDYSLISISFDPDDTPKTARDAKKNYVRFFGNIFIGDSWSFLTGTSENINKVLNAVGFAVKKDEIHGFSHPVTLVVLSPEGKIVRYVYPLEDNNFSSRKSVEFQPFDLSLAISDAAKGKTGFSVKRILEYCFPHQPKGQTAFFNVLKISGGVIALLILSFFIYLTSSSRRTHSRKQQ